MIFDMSPSQWVSFILSAVSLAGMAWTIFQGPAKKNATDLSEHKKAMGEAVAILDKRLDVAEKQIGNHDTVISQLPTRDMFHQLDKELTSVAGEVRTITATLDSAGRSLTRIEGFLIDSSRGGR